MEKDHYVFNWKDVPGKDSEALIDHLHKCLEASWVTSAEIEKSEDQKRITVTDGENALTLTRKERTDVVLDLGEEQTYAYEVHEEGENVYIYVKDVSLILRELDSEDDEGLEDLANKIAERSWNDPHVVVRILRSDDEDDVSKARAVVLSMGDIVLTPLLGALCPDVPENYVWDMQTLVDIQMENRVKIAKALETMLEDKRPLKMPDLAPDTEESFAPRRVCDEAYLTMRRLLAFEESEEEQFFNANDFLNMTDEEKDGEISRAKTSKRWIPLTEEFEGEA